MTAAASSAAHNDQQEGVTGTRRLTKGSAVARGRYTVHAQPRQSPHTDSGYRAPGGAFASAQCDHAAPVVAQHHRHTRGASRCDSSTSAPSAKQRTKSGRTSGRCDGCSPVAADTLSAGPASHASTPPLLSASDCRGDASCDIRRTAPVASATCLESANATSLHVSRGFTARALTKPRNAEKRGTLACEVCER
jgi:hypothetical protein